MKKNRFFILGTLLFSLLLTGCGETLIELEESEEEEIVSYAAAVVAKYNKNMSTGMITVYDPTVSEDSKSNSSDEVDEQPVVSQPEDENITNVEEVSSEEELGNESDASESEILSDTGQGSDLSSYLGYDGVTFELSGATVSSNYKSGNYMALMPNDGNSYLVVNVNVKNNSGSDTEIDLLSKGISYQATVNGSYTAKADNTILLNDLGTYQATLKSGSETELVLLFQFKTSILENIDSIKLNATGGDGTANITIN